MNVHQPPLHALLKSEWEALTADLDHPLTLPPEHSHKPDHVGVVRPKGGSAGPS